MSQSQNLMIVCHPDDETLWGSELLNTEDQWFILALTNGKNNLRNEKFEKSLKIFGKTGTILDFPDDGLKWKEKTVIKIKEDLDQIIKSKSYNKIVTHNPDGEYGHISHIQISKIIYDLVQDKSKLYYFSFSKIKKVLSSKAIKSLKLYFGNFKLKYLFFNNLKRFKASSIKNYYVNKLIRLLKISFIFEKIEAKIIDANFYYQHIELSKHQAHINCKAYVSQEELIKKIYKQPYKLYNKEDVYLYYSDLFQGYPSRKYLSKQYLPQCEGNVLNVGCHDFNQWDYLLVKNPKLYHTIDLEDDCERYGSPYNHKTIDYLKYQNKEKFSNIILFGVLGIPNNKEIFSLYSLYKNESKVIEKTDQLLCIGGSVLFGPDYVVDESINGEDMWDSFFKSNNILNSKYILEYKLKGMCNLIYVFKKLK